jgi:Ca2+-binding RTX toxin-like protein
MAGLSFTGRIASGEGALDTGITSLTVANLPSGPVIYGASGPVGGIAAWSLSSGAFSLVDWAIFDPSWSVLALHDPVAVDVGGPGLAVAGDGDGGLRALATDASGELGPTVVSVDLPQGTGRIHAIAQDSAGRLHFAHGPGAGIGSVDPAQAGAPGTFLQDTQGLYAADVFRLETVARAGAEYLLAASASEAGVSAFRIEDSGLTPTSALGAGEGLGVMVPTAMEVVETGGRTFVVLASAPSGGASAALSVMELRAGGGLIPTDHVIDTQATRFGGVQDIAVATAGGRAFVVAGGGDDGLSLFALLPDGRLHLMQVIAHDGQTGLANVSALAAVVGSGTLHVLAASEAEAGLSVFGMPLADPGITAEADAAGGALAGTGGDDLLLGGAGADVVTGGDGADIIGDGAGTDTLAGGAGADRFVLSGDGTADRIADFEPGQDRLDLSDWTFLYGAGQLAVTPTATGATVAFRDETLVIHRAGGGSLSAADIAAALVDAPHRQPFLDLVAPDGLDLVGTAAADLLGAGPQGDSLAGLGGDDTLDGGAGADILDGGTGRDLASYAGSGEGVTLRLWSGFGKGGEADGDSLAGVEDIAGSALDDRLVGDLEGNLLRGGAGADSLWGLSGDDTLDGGPGADLMLGQDGRDLASYAASASGVTVHLGTGDGTGGDAEGDRLRGVEDLEGSAHADGLTGDAGANLLAGGAGDDILSGGAGDDTLDGGPGEDLLTGGLGPDVFVFRDTGGADTVTDFGPGDVIDLRGIPALGGFGDLVGGAAGDTADGVTIDTGAGTILLLDIAFADLDPADFLF